MKKFLSAILAVALVLSMCTTAFAYEVSQTMDTTELTAGEDVVVTLTLDETLEAVTSFQVNLYYDADLFTLQSSENGDAHANMTITDAAKTDAKGTYYAVSVIDPSSMGIVVNAGKVYTLVFVANEDVAEGEGVFALTAEVWDASFGSDPMDVDVSADVTVSIVPGPCDHVWGEWEVTKAATCTEAGEETRACANCEETETREIPAVGHEWGEWEVTKAATCTEAGEETRACANCEETETREIPAAGHEWGEWTETKAATCTEAGEETRACANCEETETREIPMVDHNWGDDDICDDCGAEKSSASIIPVGPSKKDDEPAEVVTLPFADVAMADWFYNDVLYVYENGLMNGTSATTFAPYGITTRGQIVTILYRLEGQPAVAGECPFTDVAAGSYYEDAITWAAANGIVTGYNATTFGPNNQITREQMAAILYRYAQSKGMASMALTDNLAVFTDADKVSAYAVEAMNWAVGQGLINGMGDGTVAPQGQAIRAQAAAILHRFCETLELL